MDEFLLNEEYEVEYEEYDESLEYDGECPILLPDEYFENFRL